MSLEIRHDLFTGLAQALATPDLSGLPAWFAAPGKDWPLFDVAVQMAAHSPSSSWIEAVDALEQVAASSLTYRTQTYQSVFFGQGAPPIWLYESMHSQGRIPGSSTFTVEALYKQAGLEVIGAELPDHACNELSFLAFLAMHEARDGNESDTWTAVRKLFMKKHAGRWLPEVGRTLSRSPYPEWAAIGRLLIASLMPQSASQSALAEGFGIPSMQQEAACDLCGFCVQVCPSNALGIREDAQFTELWLQADICIRCKKCEKVCPKGALSMGDGEITLQKTLLKSSPRAICPLCGEATVSQVELDAVAERLGDRPDWLEYCLSCR